MTVADSQTARLLGQGRRLEHFTIGWNVLEAGVSVWAGIAATETPFPEKYLVARAGPFCREARPHPPEHSPEGRYAIDLEG